MLRMVKWAFAVLVFGSILLAQVPSKNQDNKQNSSKKVQGKPEETFKLNEQPSVDPNQEPTATFTSRVELVVVPVMVKKSGVHVANLKKDDFHLLENGVEKKIAIFEEIRLSAAKAARPKLGPGEFSNFAGVGTSAQQSVSIIVLSGSFLEQAYARDELIKYLKRWTDSREPISLLVRTRTGLYTLHDFTTDPNVIIAALKKVDAKHITESTPSAAPDTGTDTASSSTSGQDSDRLAAALGDFHTFSDQLQEHEQRMDTQNTLEIMQHLAQVYGGIPGRKSLIWVGSSLPLREGEYRDDVDRTWKALAAANIAVYPIDPRGLVNTSYGGAQMGRAPSIQGSVSASSSHVTSQYSLMAFADATGGEYFANRNDIDKCFETAVKDAGDYYLLGYYYKPDASSASAEQSGKDKKPEWRKLQVKVAEKGADVRAQSGFYVGVPPPTKEDVAKLAEKEEARAALSPVNYTTIEVSGRWGATTDTKDGKKRVEFQLTLPAGFAKLDEANQNRMSVDFIAVAKNHSGELVSQAAQHMAVRIPAQLLQRYYAARTVYKYALEVPLGEYNVNFIVRDNFTGRMGSVSTPLKVN